MNPCARGSSERCGRQTEAGGAARDDRFPITKSQADDPRYPVSPLTRLSFWRPKAIQEFPFAWEDKRFTVGASIGLVAIPAGGDTLTEVMSAADRACYAAKDKGRPRARLCGKR
ncbi:MAG: diguanylate cyclase domain-containing protein [Gammaproteobacteria bacterium]